MTYLRWGRLRFGVLDWCLVLNGTLNVLLDLLDVEDFILLLPSDTVTPPS